MYMLDAGSGDPYGPYGDNNGDLMAYNAFPDGLSSTPLSSLGGEGYGYDSSDMHGQQYAQQQSLLMQQQQSVSQAQAQAQAAAKVQAQAKMQAQANQASQLSQAYSLAPKSGSLVGGSSGESSGRANPQPRASPSSSDPGYLETLWQKRRDVAKLCILALAVLLAISAHSLAWHYLREYIETTPHLNHWQELGIRFAYPVIVLIFLWNFKAFF